MLTRVLLCGVVAFGCARADFQYQSTSHMTGGSLLQMMRFVPGNSAMKEPDVSTVAVHGSRMVRRGKRQAEIIDLDKRTITTVNFEKHTYSEMTFDQMKQMMEDASNKLSQAKAQNGGKANLDLDADVKDTGLRKTVNGLDAHQVIMTMSMTASDPQSGQAGAMKMNSELWISKDVPGAAEMREFYRRMAKELDWAPTGMGAMMSRPDLVKAMAKMMAEGGKMEGIPVQQIVQVGVTGDGTSDGAASSAPSTPRPSAGDLLSGALGAKLGGLGGFGRKKKQDAPAADAETNDAPGTAQASGSLMEMTIDNTGFTTGSVDAALFAVPVDFRKVAADQPGRRGK